MARGAGRSAAALACALALALAGGCSFGPKALERSHGCYNESIRRVYEEELLRNVVHMRYHEGPLALNVVAVAAQYELSGQAEARPFFGTESSGNIFRSFRAVLPDVLVGGANRPTITLDPADDGTAVRQFLTPIPRETLVFLIQTGYPVSTLTRLWVERLNGVPNAAGLGGPQRCVAADFSRFGRVAELLQRAEDQELVTVRVEEQATEVSGPLPAEAVTAAAAVEAAKGGLEYRPRGDGQTWALVRPERRLVLQVTPGSEGAPELAELEGLLNLVPGQRRYGLVTGREVPDPLRHPSPPSADLRVQTRSTSQVYSYLAQGVEVPPEHLACGLVRPALDAEGKAVGPELTRGLFEVHVCQGRRPPAEAYVAVKYRGYWFYVDDHDAASKATLALMLQLSRLDFKRQKLSAGPTLTLPVGR